MLSVWFISVVKFSWGQQHKVSFRWLVPLYLQNTACFLDFNIKHTALVWDSIFSSQSSVPPASRILSCESQDLSMERILMSLWSTALKDTQDPKLVMGFCIECPQERKKICFHPGCLLTSCYIQVVCLCVYVCTQVCAYAWLCACIFFLTNCDLSTWGQWRKMLQVGISILNGGKLFCSVSLFLYLQFQFSLLQA